MTGNQEVSRLQWSFSSILARADLIIVKSSSWEPISVNLIGTKSVEESKPALFPSDHFGVVGEFEFKGWN